ncbi:MAG: hypothetical protein HRT88_13355, partial [Lentisphaeraceae bacterium]|nr:hypothetical protein [Lentisphaeraceae bacterium]
MRRRLLMSIAAIMCLASVSSAADNFNNFIPPASNPINFESPFNTTEARLFHLRQRLN